MPLSSRQGNKRRLDGVRGVGSRLGLREASPGWVRYGRGTALVFEFTGTVGAGALVGYGLDRECGTEPWLLIVLTLVGVVGGFVRLVQVVQRLERGRG